MEEGGKQAAKLALSAALSWIVDEEHVLKWTERPRRLVKLLLHTEQRNMSSFEVLTKNSNDGEVTTVTILGETQHQ